MTVEPPSPSAHRLDRLGVDDLVACSAAFKELTASVTTMADAAQAITGYLHERLVDADGAPACPLVRFYKTHRIDQLDEELRAFAERGSDGPLPERTRCLTLLGTRGVEEPWNDRRASVGHRAIPLVSAEVVEQSPMIASLIGQLGLDVAHVVAPDSSQRIALHHRDYDVFFVPDAVGSPMVPAQEGFVRPYGIHSVVGCGGVLPSGDLFALILFTRLHLDAATADLFRTLALSVKASIVKLSFRVFAAG